MSGSGSGIENEEISRINSGKTFIKLPEGTNKPENSILLTALMVMFTAVTFGLFLTIIYVCFKHKWLNHVRSRMSRLNAIGGRFSLNRNREIIEMTSSRMPLDI